MQCPGGSHLTPIKTDKSQEATEAAVPTTENSEIPTSKLPVPVPEPEMPTRPLPVPVPEPETYRAPIVTYPEFMTRRQRAPPLITASGFMQTAAALAGFATIVYGASQYVLTPMVSSLTDARAEAYEQVSRGLDTLVSKLEEAVSEIPPTPPTKNSTTAAAATEATTQQQQGGNDAASSCGDPTEVFHRDIGIQTEITPPMTLALRQQQEEEADDVIGAQARRVSGLAASLREVNGGLASESEEYAIVNKSLDTFKDDLDRLTRPYQMSLDFPPLFGRSTLSEPDDAVKELKKNIRGVKGVLLTSRSFPAAGR